MSIWLEPSADNLEAAEQRVRWWIRAFKVASRPWVRFEVHGAETLPKSGPALLVANHANMFDPFFGIAGVGRPVHWFGTATLQQQGPVARFLRDSGAIPKQRFKKDLLAARLAMRWARVGGIIGVFPEGERSWDGGLQTFVPGVDRLVKVLKVPVFGLRMENTYRQWPRWSPMPRHGRVSLHFEPIDCGDDPIAAMRRVLEPRGSELPVRAWNVARGLSQLVFSCPSCRAESMKEVRNSLVCTTCGERWAVDTGHLLTGPTPHRLADLMAEQESRAIAAWEAETPAVVLRSGRTTLVTPDGSHDGHLVLRPDRLELERSGHVAWTLPLSEVLHANVEFQRRFEVHTEAGIFRADLPETDSGWRWGWSTRWFAGRHHGGARETG